MRFSEISKGKFRLLVSVDHKRLTCEIIFSGFGKVEFI